MSRLPEAFLEALRDALPAASVVGRRVKLQRKGRQHQGCCPFHPEKTPSFWVYDDHFHCFGCGAHGDVISFEQKLGGGEFREVVERLAAEAGLEMPAPDPVEQRRVAQANSLLDVLELAARTYERWLWSPAGAEGLAYLRRRGLTDATLRAWRLGWSGPGRGALSQELAQHGVEQRHLLEAGLLLERDGRPVDLYFGRVMFPITDRKGRVISFSGRVLGDAKPKYVNGPETAVFSKRRTLFGLAQARAGVFAGQPALVVEGQLDVIALHQAGFTGAMAPLGTALTLEHLGAIWQVSPEPCLAFDGDGAGLRAQAKSVEMMLPELTPECSARLAMLPAGRDPDELLRAEGPEGMARVIAAARPVSAALYGLLAEGAPRVTPEQRTALRARLEAAAAAIRHRALAGEYRRALLDAFFAAGKARREGGVPQVASRPEASLAAGDAARLRLILAVAADHPALRGDIAAWLEAVPLPDGVLGTFAHAMIAGDEGAIRAMARELKGDRPVIRYGDITEADRGWREAVAEINRGRIADDVVSAAGMAQFSAVEIARLAALREQSVSFEVKWHLP